MICVSRDVDLLIHFVMPEKRPLGSENLNFSRFFYEIFYKERWSNENAVKTVVVGHVSKNNRGNEDKDDNQNFSELLKSVDADEKQKYHYTIIKAFDSSHLKYANKKISPRINSWKSAAKTSLVEDTAKIKIRVIKHKGAKFYRLVGGYEVVDEEKIRPKVFHAERCFRFSNFYATSGHYSDGSTKLSWKELWGRKGATVWKYYFQNIQTSWLFANLFFVYLELHLKTR